MLIFTQGFLAGVLSSVGFFLDFFKEIHMSADLLIEIDHRAELVLALIAGFTAHESVEWNLLLVLFSRRVNVIGPWTRSSLSFDSLEPFLISEERHPVLRLIIIVI